MNNEAVPQSFSSGSVDTSKKPSGRLESIGFWIFLATIILAPLAFWPSPYLSLDLVKTFVIALGTIISVILFSFVAIKERRLVLPPKSLTRTSTLIAVSLVISSLLSIQATKSFFGQGFEIGNASFIILLFVAGLAAFTIVSRQKERAIVLYVGIAAAYVVTYLFQLLRLIFGPQFMTLGIFNSATSSMIGGWYSLGAFSMLIVIVSMLALLLLKLSSKMKIVYWVLLVLSALGTLVVAGLKTWQMIAALIFLGLSVFLSYEKWKIVRKSTIESKTKSFFKSLAWIPVVAFLISAIFVWQVPGVVQPVVTKLNAGYSELVLPWQMTLDVSASTIQNYPLFGVGPNHFSQAFLAYKPTQINATNFWGAEFQNGFGLIPTFVATQGLVGAILWILLFVFFGILSVKVLKNLPQESDKRFMVLSSFTMSVFLWLIVIVSVPSHTILLYAFVLTGIFFAVATTSGIIPSRSCAPANGTRTYKMFPSLMAILVLVLVVWGLVYMKKTIALSYFGSGVKELTISGNTDSANASFVKAIKFDESDIYWRAKVETALVSAQKLASTVNSSMSASTTQGIITQIGSILNQGISDANKAIAFDSTNYYNYLSLARISEATTDVQMQGGYENTIKAYNSAINMNPFNPSIYLALASFEARQKKYDDSLKDLGKALQVKNNYLDAIFLLSQVYAAKGDAANAITAAKVAVELNPQSPQLLFQLGILDYNVKDYSGAAQALDRAVKIQPDYANAKYFLGLSFARLNNIEKAIVQFEDLAKTNPENQEVSLILSNLKSGKSIFGETKASATTPAEKRSSLPIKEKR